MSKKIFRELSFDNKAYMYTARLNNGVVIVAFEDGTAQGDNGKKYRLVSHIDSCEFCDVLDTVVVDGWEEVEE